MKEWFRYLGAMVSFGTILWFCWRIFTKRTEKLSTASWFMITVVEAVLLAATIAARKPFWLPLSYVAGALCVTTSLFICGEWRWSSKETFCAALAAIALCIWQTCGATVGMYAGAAALAFAGIPMFIEMIFHPIRDTFRLWVFLSIACILTLFGSDWSPVQTALPWSSLGFNVCIAILSLRGRKEGVPC